MIDPLEFKEVIDEVQKREFMVASNEIEGEQGLNPNDEYAMDRVLKEGINGLDDILALHGVVAHHLNENWTGKWRQVNVRVGKYYPPNWHKVPELMNEFWQDWEEMDSWEAHNRFQKIHPFRDFNGRIGRLIWLVKAIQEDYKFQRTFLHHYYYQTLRNQSNEN